MKKILPILVLLVCCIGIVSAAYTSDWYPEQRSGVGRISSYDPRVQGYKRSDVTAYLKPVEPKETNKEFLRGYPYYAPRATARILSSMSAYMPQSQVYIKTNDLKPSYIDNIMYEGWLYDEDSGVYISVGTFFVSMGGTGAVEARLQHYLDNYDYIIVTKEPTPDNDPRPGEQVLIAEIPKPDLYPAEPSFGQSKQQYGYGLG